MSPNSFSDWRRAWIDAHDAGVTIMMRALEFQRALLKGGWTGGPESQAETPEKIVAARQELATAASASLRAIATPKSAEMTTDRAAAPASSKARSKAKLRTPVAKKRRSAKKAKKVLRRRR